MKNRKKIGIVLMSMMIMIPLLGQNAKGAISVGDYSFSSYTTSGYYIVWQVTSVNSFEIMTCIGPFCSDNPVSVGDKFKLTIMGQAYFDDYDPWTGEGDLTKHPCISATLTYFNATSETWTYLIGSSWGSSQAFFMYNSTSNTYYGSDDYFEEFMLFILPANFNLTLLGQGVLFEDARNNINLYPSWDDFSATTDTLNFTRSSGTEWNYVKMRSDGIVDTWNYNYNSEQIVAEYESTGHEAAPVSIPFGFEYLVGVGICVIGLIIIVRKKILIRKAS